MTLEELAAYVTPEMIAEADARKAAEVLEEEHFWARVRRTERDRIARNIAIFGDPDFGVTQ